MRTDDGELVQAVLQGSTELFAELVDRHAASVFRLVRAAVSQDADAEDVAQEAFLSSYRNLRRLRDPARYRAWLLSIAARRVLDHLRRTKRRGPVLPLEVEPVAPRPSARRELLATIDAAVAALPPDARLLFALRHHEGLSCARIAQLLDVAVGTVYSRLSRIHGAIRGALGVEGR